MHRLAALLVDGDGRYARAFESLIFALIVFSVLSVALVVTPGLPGWALQALRVGEVVVVAVFSLEYLLRIVAAPKKLRFLFSFEGLVDLARFHVNLDRFSPVGRFGAGLYVRTRDRFEMKG